MFAGCFTYIANLSIINYLNIVRCIIVYLKYIIIIMGLQKRLQLAVAGNMCNGRKGLKMHQCSCRVIKGLARETLEEQNTIDEVVFVPERNAIIEYVVSIKAVTKLPKFFDQWRLANEYFITASTIAEITTSNLLSILCNIDNFIHLSPLSYK